MLSTIASILKTVLNPIDNGKTVTGIVSMVLGFLVYIGKQYGIDPAAPSGLGLQITDLLINVLGYGGAGMTTLGLGHKMGKV